jgi:osmotically-inducible protein OsmY
MDQGETIVKLMSQLPAVLGAMALATSVAACSNTARGVQQDAERATEKVAAGVETVDVKSALIADGRVDASNVNVDTHADTKTVVLKGTVPSAEQRTTAGQIAREQAKGYTITNQLTVAPKQ